MAKKHDFQEQKTRQRQKITFFRKISKTMDKMIFLGMSAPFLMMPVTLQGIKTWASKILFFELLVAQAALVAQAVGHVYC